MSRNRTAISMVALLCLGAAPSPQKVPSELRPFLRYGMMSNHGEDLLRLMAAVTLLQYEEVEESATRIADEPRLARVGSNALDSPNAAIPARFFELQDALRPPARALAAAAKRHDDARIGQALGQVVQACVACHAVYLPRSAPHAAPTRPDR